MTAPYQCSSVEGVLANHEKRVGILEADAGVGCCGIQFHSGTYGPINVGDWLVVKTTGLIDSGLSPLPQNAISNNDAGMFLNAHDGVVQRDIALWGDDILFIGRDVGTFDNTLYPIIGMTSTGWLGYLNGDDELVYTQGGNFTRYTGGGTAAFYTTDAAITASGDFLVYTSGSNDDTGGVGSIELHVDNSVGPAGNISLLADGGTPGKIRLSSVSNGSWISVAAGSVAADIDVGASFLVQQAFPGNVLFEVTEAGEIFAFLPTAAGTAGSLWNDSGMVKVA